MTAKRERFIAEYLIDLNATQAAIRAGFSQKTAYSQGERLLRNVEVSQEIAKRKEKQLAKAELTADRVLEEVRRLAFANIWDLFDDEGNLKKKKDLTLEQQASVSSLEVVLKNAEAGDGKIDRVLKVKVWDKPRALELAMRHLGLLIENMNINGPVVFQWQNWPKPNQS